MVFALWLPWCTFFFGLVSNYRNILFLKCSFLVVALYWICFMCWIVTQDLESGGGLGGGVLGPRGGLEKNTSSIFFLPPTPPPPSDPIPSALPHLLACLVLSLVCIVCHYYCYYFMFYIIVLVLVMDLTIFLHSEKTFCNKNHALTNVCPASKKAKMWSMEQYTPI